MDLKNGLLPLAKIEGGLGFRLIEGRWWATDDDGGASVATEGLLENTGQLRVSVGHMGLGVVGQGGYHVAQSREGLVDVLGFIQHCSFSPGFAHLWWERIGGLIAGIKWEMVLLSIYLFYRWIDSNAMALHISFMLFYTIHKWKKTQKLTVWLW